MDAGLTGRVVLVTGGGGAAGPSFCSESSLVNGEVVTVSGGART